MNILKPSRKLKGWIMYTVEPPLTGTFPQRPPLYNGHFFGGQSIHWLLMFKPPYKGHFLLSLRWPLWRGLTVVERALWDTQLYWNNSWLCEAMFTPQSNVFNKDTKGTETSVRFREVSVL